MARLARRTLRARPRKTIAGTKETFARGIRKRAAVGRRARSQMVRGLKAFNYLCRLGDNLQTDGWSGKVTEVDVRCVPPSRLKIANVSSCYVGAVGHVLKAEGEIVAS